MMVRNLSLGTACVAVLLSGCASAGRTAGVEETRRPSRRGDVLTGTEILERAPGATSVRAAIQRLRSTWLRRGQGTRSFQGETPIKVYVDNVLAGTLEVLDSYAIERIYEIRFYNPRDATARWGSGHTSGAIEIIAGTPEAPARRQPRNEPSAQPKPADDVTFEPYVPHIIQPVFVATGGASIVTTPREVSEVWDPARTVGAGIGITATRSITLFAMVEINRFDFSRSGTLAYLMDQERGSLKSTDGVELAGESSTIFNVSGNVKIHPHRGLVRPYLYGSLGYARLSAGTFRISGPAGQPLPRTQFPMQTAVGGNQVENGFSVGGGVGFDIVLGEHLQVFADGRYITIIRGPRYHDVFGKNQLFNTAYYPLRVGLTYR